MTFVLHQVKPLLQVTNNEDKLNAKEEELRRILDRYEKQNSDVDDLGRKQQQLMEEKNILSEQLQAETELCAEAEEVGSLTLPIYRICLICRAPPFAVHPSIFSNAFGM